LLSFAKVGSKFGEVFAKYLIDNLPNTLVFFDLMLQVTSYNVNVDIPQATFFFWFNLEDSLDYDNELNQKKIAEHIIRHGNQIMYRLLGILVSQMKYGSDSEMQSVSKDYKDKIKSHRVECADTALYCYYNLQDKALEFIYSLFHSELQQLSSNGDYGTQGLEATVYCLKCFSEAISIDESKWSPLLFNSSSLTYIQQLIGANRDGSKLLRLTLAACFGSYSEWLSNQPEFLPVSLNFLLQELANCDQPTSAAISLTELASLCQIPLSKHADEVLNLCMNSLPNIPAHVQSKIIQSMLYIIQPLPIEEAMPRSNFILNSIVDQLEQDIVIRKTSGNAVEVKESLELHLEFYKSFCKGSNKAIIDLDPSTLERQMTSTEALLGKRLLACFEQIFQLWIVEQDVLVKLCEVIKDSARCDNAIIMNHLSSFLRLLAVVFEAEQHSCFLSAAASIMAYSTTQLIGLSQNEYEECCNRLVCTFAEKCSSVSNMQQDPDVPFDFFEFFIEVIRKLPKTILSYDDSLCRILFLDCLVQGLGLKEQLAIQAILKFLREFVATGYEGSPLESFTKNIFAIIQKPVIYQLVKVFFINVGYWGWTSIQPCS
jgi:hypothetical protein